MTFILSKGIYAISFTHNLRRKKFSRIGPWCHAFKTLKPRKTNLGERGLIFWRWLVQLLAYLDATLEDQGSIPSKAHPGTSFIIFFLHVCRRWEIIACIHLFYKVSMIYRQSSVKKPTIKIFQVIIPSIFYPFYLRYPQQPWLNLK